MMKPIRHLALLGAILLALAACGGATSEATSPTLPSLSEPSAQEQPAATTTTMAVDPEEAFREYAACMREHGVEMADPGTDGGGAITIGGDAFDVEALEEAGKACDPLLEGAFGEFEMTPEMEAEIRDQELALAQCMRANGVEDWPDPDASGATMIELGDVDPDTVNAAMEVCSEDVFGSTGGGTVIGGLSSGSGEATP